MKLESFFLAVLSLSFASAVPSHGDEVDKPVDFTTQIRPILKENCTKCHGGVQQAADVSFVYREQTIDSGIIIPGEPTESELIARVTSTDPDLRMPPPGEDPAESQPLTEAEISLLSQWIEQGAPWGEHWALQRPTDHSLPVTQDDDWASQPLDAFVLARLESEKLQPSVQATPHEWLRRVSFDLIGLPTTPAETDRFLKACRDGQLSIGDVYEDEVNRLLASDHYGERWAAMWMDLARYADTKGFEKDPHRDMWPYRDWLIKAFNDDMPFDQFTIKQLAGDLLESPTADDLIATAFHRNTQTNTEGGTDDEEFRVASVIDRINTTWTVWQATTFGCVQCHSHPFDPFRNEEYYNFMAFFNNTEDHDLDNDYPNFRLPSDPERALEAVGLDRQLQSLRRELNQAGQQLAAQSSDWKPLVPTAADSSHGTLAMREQEVRVAAGTFPPGCEYAVTAAAVPFTAMRVDIHPESDDPKAWPETGSVVSKLEIVLLLPDGQQQPITIEEVFADHLAGPYDPREAIRDGDAGVGGYPKLFGPRWAVFVMESPVNPADGASLMVKLHQDAQTTGSRAVHVRRFSLSTSNLPAWTALVESAERADAWQAHARLEERRKALEGTLVPVMKQRDPAGARPTRRFVRGNWLAHGELATPNVPAVLPSIAGENITRLELAKWLVADDNPLTARVFANRLWAQLFGSGIVETLEDFGSTGALPSHPALLDHLALRLQQTHAWRLKPFLKEIVLSSTYRQTNRIPAALQAKDPRNRLLARGPRTRLSAEMIRDQALTVSGLLTPKLGGPSVMPPQPDGVWTTVYSNAQWKTAEGPDRYRRALYTYWRRTSPYPSFLSFDAPTREYCTARRVPTNSPLQALVTLNDPVYMECASALAKRAREAGGANEQDWIRWAFVATMQQPPSDLSLAQLNSLYQAAVQEYQADVAGVKDLADNAEDYAMTIVANTILNLDMALVK